MLHSASLHEPRIAIKVKHWPGMLAGGLQYFMLARVFSPFRCLSRFHDNGEACPAELGSRASSGTGCCGMLEAHMCLIGW